MIDFPPGLLLILGALLIPLFRSVLRNAYMLALPIVGFWGLFGLADGQHFAFQFFGYALTPVRVDGLSLIFGYVFHIAAAVCVIYAFHIKDTMQQIAGMVYAGSAIGGVFAGDLISLFVYWEGTAIASVFLIWGWRTEASYRSGLRYLIIQVGSGVLLLGGIIVLINDTGAIAFDKMQLEGLGPTLIFVAIGIKAAFPLLNNWLQDSYPQATGTGTVFLSCFTTKLAIYALARGFPGTEILIWIGAVMAFYPVFYSVIENDLRRVLAYSLNSQLGFMTIGVGIGTELSLNGTAAHAFASVLYKALLFMSVGSVLLRTGTAKASELGGLHRTMPWTAGFCMIGAASISAVPLLCGFVSKSLIISAAAQNAHWAAWLVLLFASLAAIYVAGIRIPFAMFFGKDSGKRPEEAPPNMLIAMGITAFLCVAIGTFPGFLYDLLPYGVEYAPYTVTHVVTQLQMIFFAALAFGLLTRLGLFPNVANTINLDFDWIYRRLLPAIIKLLGLVYVPLDRMVRTIFLRRLEGFIGSVFRHHGPEGAMARSLPTGSTVLWVAVLLALYMIFYFV